MQKKALRNLFVGSLLALALIVVGSKNVKLGTAFNDFTLRTRTVGIEAYEHHAAPVRSIAVAPDGTAFASASHDNSAAIWELGNHKPILILNRHFLDSVNSVAFSSDGTLLATGGDAGVLRIWDVKTGQELTPTRGFLLPPDKPELHRADAGTLGVQLAPDSRHFLTFGENDPIAIIHPMEPGNLPIALSGHKEGITAAAWAADGNTVVTGGLDGRALVWDVSTGQPIKELRHEHPVSAVIYSTDQGKIITGSWDGKIRIWSSAHYELTREFAAQMNAVNRVANSFDGLALAVAGQTGEVWIWDMQGQPMAVLRGHTDLVRALAWLPGSDRLLSASDDRSIRLWDAVANIPLGILLGHKDSVRDISLSPDGTLLASASDDGSIALWDIRLGHEIRRLTGNFLEPSALSFSADGKILVSVAADEPFASVWDAETGSMKATHQIAQRFVESGPIVDIDFSPSSGEVVTAHLSGELTLWDRASGIPKWQNVLSGGMALYSAAFSPDGQTIVAASQDNSAYLIEPQTGRVAQRFDAHLNEVNDAVFSPDGQWLATASDDGEVIVWNLDSRSVESRLRGHSTLVLSVTISFDSKRLASVDAEGNAILWNLVEAKEVANVSLGGDAGPIWDVEFSKEDQGYELLLGTQDGRVYAWNPSSR